MSELIFDKQINYGWGKTFNMTGKAPIVSKRIFEKLSDAYDFINDYNDSAIEGLLLSVISDGNNNGVYRVAKIATKAGEQGSLVKLVDQDALDVIVNDFNVFIIPDGNQLPEEDIKEGKIYLIQTESSADGNVYTEYTYVNDAWEILGEYRASVDLSPYYTKTEVNDLISNTEGKLIFGGGENNTIVGNNGHEANFKFRPTSLFESDINGKSTSVISQNLDRIELKNNGKSVTLNSNGFYYGVTSSPYNQIATINDIKNKIPTNISYFENKDGEIVPSSGEIIFNTSYREADDVFISNVNILGEKTIIEHSHYDDSEPSDCDGSNIEVNSNGTLYLSSFNHDYMGRNERLIEINRDGAFYKVSYSEGDNKTENREIATMADISAAIEGVITGDLTSALTNYVHVDNIVDGNIDSYTGNSKNHVASVKHTHNYISSKGQTQFGKQGSGSVAFEDEFNLSADEVVLEGGNANSKLSLKSNGINIEQSGSTITFNNNKFDIELGVNGETLSYNKDGLSVDGTPVSLEGHTHNASAITGGTFDIARIPTGKTNNTVAVGDHSHNYDSIIVDEDTYLSEYIDYLERRITSLESIISALTIDGASIITTANIDNYAVTPKNIPNYAVTSIHTNGSDIALGGYASEGYYSGIVSINLAGISNIAFDDAISIDANNLGAN